MKKIFLVIYFFTFISIEVHSLELDISWVEATSSAQWSARNFHQSVVFDNKIWVFGGIGNAGSLDLNDVWSSEDGITWTLVTASAPWGIRHGHSAVVHNGKMWVLGGAQSQAGGGQRFKDVWSSEDGVNWTLVTSFAPWYSFLKRPVVSFQGKMWVLGGLALAGAFNDVWSSEDGVNWEFIPSIGSKWEPRGRHAATIFNNKIWISGGTRVSSAGSTTLNDVWCSSDGRNWEKTSSSAWPVRWGHTSLAFENELWVLGGVNNVTHMNDVWSSPDGVTWEQAISSPWAGRRTHSSVVYNNQMWVIGGYNGQSFRNVWRTDLPIRESIPATIDLSPNKINLKSEGKWITCHISLPKGFDIYEIDIETIAITGFNVNSCEPDYFQLTDLSFWPVVEDYDEDEILDLKVKFDRQILQDHLCTDDVGIIISGNLINGDLFSGQDSLRVFKR